LQPFRKDTDQCIEKTQIFIDFIFHFYYWSANYF